MTQREEALHNEARVLNLRAQGRTVEQIAADPSVSITTSSGVSKALRRGLERRSQLGAEELVTLSLAQLDQIDAVASTVVTMPGVGAAEIIRALDLRRKLIESRAKIAGHTGTAAQGVGSRTKEAAPDAGVGILTVMSLNDAPVEVLPSDLQPVRQIAEDAKIIRLDPDWKPRVPYALGEQGKLLRGNMLFTASDLQPWLEWRQKQLQARWKAQGVANQVRP